MATAKIVNCFELPQTICVETRVIAHSSINFDLSRQDQMVSAKNSGPVLKPTTVTLSIQQNQPTSPANSTQQCPSSSLAQSAFQIVPLATTLTNFSNKEVIALKTAVTVPSNNPNQLQPNNTSVQPITPLGIVNNLNVCSRKDQTQQSDFSTFNMKSVAIQCKLDDEEYEADFELPDINEEYLESQENSDGEKERLIDFVEQNSTYHNNYMECLVCGEISKSRKYFYGHMAIHRGPKSLCSKCGQYLDDNNMLRQHKCRIAKQLEKAFLICPHYSCSVVAISRLELYDHINEHNNNHMYKCSGCLKGFCTGQEFLRHLFFNAKCYTSAKRKRFRVYGLDSLRDRLCRVRVFTLHTFKKRTTLVKAFLSQRTPKQGICRICLKTFAHKSVYKRHRVRCIDKFKKRLIRKRN